MTCGVEFVKWFWTGPWLVTCRQPEGHDGEHHEVPPDADIPSVPTGTEEAHCG